MTRAIGSLNSLLTAENAQQDPHWPWFLTSVTAPFVRQSIDAGRPSSPSGYTYSRLIFFTFCSVLGEMYPRYPRDSSGVYMMKERKHVFLLILKLRFLYNISAKFSYAKLEIYAIRKEKMKLVFQILLLTFVILPYQRSSWPQECS